MPANESTCIMCSEGENGEDMVQCDSCSKWYHCNCVGITAEEVTNISWHCVNCKAPPNSSSSPLNTNGPSSSNSVNNVLPVVVHLPQNDADTKMPTTTGIASKAGVNVHTSGNALMRKESSESRYHISPKLAYHPINTIANSFNNLLLPTIPSMSSQQPKISTRAAAQPAVPEMAAAISAVPEISAAMSAVPEMAAALSASQRECELKLELLEEEHKLQKMYLEKKYEILASVSSSPSSGLQATTFGVSSQMPTKAQLAARQAIPKELPKFSGDPEEWALFINSFESSTQIAGYSHAENLIRLQHCLRVELWKLCGAN